MAPPFQTGRSPLWKIAGWYVAALLAHGLIDPGGHDPFVWGVKALMAGWLAVWFVRAVRDGRVPLDWQLLGLTPWHRSEPWRTIAGGRAS